MSYTKYIVTSDETVAEFSSIDDAQSYISENDIQSYVISSGSYVTSSKSNHDIFREKVEIGYNIPNTPYFLGLEDVDRAQFSSMLNLLREAQELGYITTESIQYIRDKNNNDIPMTVGNFKALMVGYGMYFKTIWDERNAEE
jgi:hypothetical protein